jgi:hypothetical protein
MLIELGRQRGAATPGVASLAVAAILLVLHWAAPSFQPFIAFAESHDAAPGISASKRFAQPGSLPRAQPRIVSIETSLPVAKRSVRLAGGEPQAVLRSMLAVPAFGAPGVLPPDVGVAPKSSPARAFNARAPPSLKA